MSAKTPCQPFEAKLTAYLLGDLPPAQAAAVKAHAELCPACQETLRDLAATIELLRNAFAAEAVATPPCLTPERRAAVLRQAQSRPRLAGVWALLTHPYAKIALRTAAVAALLLAIIWVLLPSLARNRTRPATIAVGVGGGAAEARQADGVAESASTSGAVIQAQSMGDIAAATPEHSLSGASAEPSAAAHLPSPVALEEKAASLAAGPVAAAAEPVALAAQATNAAKAPSVDADAAGKADLATQQDRASKGGGTAAGASGKAAAMVETNGTAVFAAAQPVAPPHAEAQQLVQAPAAEARPGDVKGQHRVAPGAPAKATSTVIKIPMTSGKITRSPKKAAAGSGPAASAAGAGSAVAMKSADGTATLAWATAPQSGVAREAKAAPANATRDVDTAAYALARRCILLGQRPPPASVRVKGFVNAFEYEYAPPAKPAFAIYANVVPSPFRPALDVLTIAVKGHRPDGSSAPRTVAKDVRIQVQFNPERVAGFRQFGSDNRPPVSAQSHDDTVDAGEVGSGQAVTVLYEVAPGARLGEPVGVVRVRYRDVETGKIVELEKSIGAADRIADVAKAPSRVRLALGVAEFAELLRGSPSVAGSDFGQVLTVLQPVAQELPLDAGVQELVRLVQTTRDLPAAPK